MKRTQLQSGIIALTILLVLSSCNSGNKFASSFGKRKYTKGYFFDKISANKSLLSKDSKPLSVSKNSDLKRKQNSVSPYETKLSSIMSNETKLSPDKTSPVKEITKTENTVILPDNCDEIVLANGNILNAHVVQIGLSSITYKDCDNLTGPDIVIEKSQVLSIKYANGKVAVVNQSNKTETTANPVQKEGDASKNWAAVLGFVLAFFFPLLGLIFSIIGLPSKHHGLAVAGIILSSIFLIITIAALLVA